MSDIQKYCVKVLGLGLTQIRWRLIRESPGRHVCYRDPSYEEDPKVPKNRKEGLCRCMHGICFTRRPVKVMQDFKKYTVPTNLSEQLFPQIPTNLSEQCTWCSNRKQDWVAFMSQPY